VEVPTSEIETYPSVELPRSPYATQLPHARVGSISGLLELIVEEPEGSVDIPRLAERIQLEVDDLLPILDASVLLDFAEVIQGDVKLTEIGQDFATTTILRSKDLFQQQVLANVPVLVSMIQTLREKRNRSMRAGFFIDLLNEYFSDKESERQFATAVDWGRYAELFEYDASEERLYLPEPVAANSDEVLE
jgi:NitT/TauT family transport system ATP-binding protein